MAEPTVISIPSASNGVEDLREAPLSKTRIAFLAGFLLLALIALSKLGSSNVVSESDYVSPAGMETEIASVEVENESLSKESSESEEGSTPLSPPEVVRKRALDPGEPKLVSGTANGPGYIVGYRWKAYFHVYNYKPALVAKCLDEAHRVVGCFCRVGPKRKPGFVNRRRNGSAWRAWKTRDEFGLLGFEPLKEGTGCVCKWSVRPEFDGGTAEFVAEASCEVS